MTATYSEQRQYGVSILGRIIYLIAALIYLPFGLVIIDLWYAGKMHNIFMYLIGLPFGLFMTYIAIYSLFRALGPGLRFVVGGSGFTYYGMFSTINLKWGEIDSYQINFSGKGPVTMSLRLKQRRWPRNRKRLDLSGIQPPFQELISEFKEIPEIGRLS
ncbi:MAG: hypothetical protein ACYC1F_02145 [Gallionellaceae bacterium]